ncbi:hypothetical protein CDL15_Pgr011123 [Punica granatum]|uniref:Uncharacterized protein n=1 Tax=Punica granatum TaxID=22663 RepID=A0A218XNP7_PUNGR|nr:hypothetical protein CDL15_Pgr011123 [Punica granatum]
MPVDIHSGMVSSTGLQPLFNSALYLIPTNPLLGISPPAAPPIPIASGNPSFLSLHLPPSSSSPSSSLGCEPNRSLSLCPPAGLLSFFFSRQGTGPTKNCRSSEPRRRRPSSIRRVVFWGRPMWTRGLVRGLRVGLWATPHCVANILNFCKVAIFFFPKIFPFFRLVSSRE